MKTRSGLMKGGLAGALLAAAIMSGGAAGFVAPNELPATNAMAPVTQPEGEAAPATAKIRTLAGIKVLEQVHNKVDPGVIITNIRSALGFYNVSATELEALRQRGVSADILKAIMERNAELKGEGGTSSGILSGAEVSVMVSDFPFGTRYFTSGSSNSWWCFGYPYYYWSPWFYCDGYPYYIGRYGDYRRDYDRYFARYDFSGHSWGNNYARSSSPHRDSSFLNGLGGSWPLRDLGGDSASRNVFQQYSAERFMSGSERVFSEPSRINFGPGSSSMRMGR